MKRVQIKSAQTPDKSNIVTQQKRFTILLGNGVHLTYTTQKDTNYALAEINRKLNVIMFELNEMWIFSFTEYRRIWFYIPSTVMDVNNQAMNELNEDITRAFALLTERSSWVNGNVFSFKFLFQITKSLKSELSVMAELRRMKKQYMEFHLLEMKKKTVERIEQDLKTMTVDAKYSAKSKSNVQS